MPNPQAVPGSIGDVTGYVLWNLGLGVSPAEAFMYAEANFAGQVSPFNIQAGWSAAMNAANIAGMMESTDMTVDQLAPFIPSVAGAPAGYNYEAIVTVINSQTGAQEDRVLRINSADLLDRDQICNEAYRQVDVYIDTSDRWAGFERALAAESVEDVFDCQVVAVYQG